eukprot:COSAG01_NODE_25751_length_734_cov_1.823622_1_plen_150_part_00
MQLARTQLELVEPYRGALVEARFSPHISHSCRGPAGTCMAQSRLQNARMCMLLLALMQKLQKENAAAGCSSMAGRRPRRSQCGAQCQRRLRNAPPLHPVADNGRRIASLLSGRGYGSSGTGFSATIVTPSLLLINPIKDRSSGNFRVEF